MSLVNTIKTYSNRLLEKFNCTDFLKNISWMLISEVASRLSRLITIIVLGYCLTPIEYGTAMLAIICHELIRVFTRVGSGPKIIQCDESKLTGFAQNAITLQWFLCITLCLTQLYISPYIANYYNNPNLAFTLNLMAISHLIYPIVTVKVFLVQRENNMLLFAKATGASIMLENISTAILALLGLGVLSVAIAKILSALLWVSYFINAKVVNHTPRFNISIMKELMSYAGKILSSELLKTLRQQIDSLLAARILSPELFGIYSFAKSAGVGLSHSVSSGFLSSVYPYLCDQARKNILRLALKRTYYIALGISGIFVLQALLAPVYISLLFDEKWENSAYIVAILCLSAIPSLLIDTTSMFYRACNKPLYELYICIYCTVSMYLSLIILSPATPEAFAIVVTVLSWSWLFIIIAPLFNKSQIMQATPKQNANNTKISQ